MCRTCECVAKNFYIVHPYWSHKGRRSSVEVRRKNIAIVNFIPSLPVLFYSPTYTFLFTAPVSFRLCSESLMKRPGLLPGINKYLFKRIEFSSGPETEICETCCDKEVT